MAVRGLKELIKRERPREVTPFHSLERMFEETWKNPLSMLSPFIWSDLRTDLYEVSPTVDIYEEGNEMVMKADLPGIKKEDIKVEIAENVLTISGEKKKTETTETEGYYRSERTFGAFNRRFELPAGLDTEKVKAHYEDGILELRIPMKKEAERKHTKISID